MVNKKLLIILFSLALLFSFTITTFAKKAPENINTKFKKNFVKDGYFKATPIGKINSPQDRIAKRNAIFKQRGLTKEQVINQAKKRNALKANQELDPAAIDDVPGGGDIYTAFEVSFDYEDDFLLFDLLDLSADQAGNDWFWFDYTQYYGEQYRYLNSAFAPEPGGDMGGDVEAKDEAIQVKIGIPEESNTGIPYRVSNLLLELYIGEPDADDVLWVEINEPPKWHLLNGEWAMTSNQYSVPGYGNGWREDLRTPFIDLSAATGAVTLTFDHYYGMESGNWDGGNLWARTDENSAWVLLTPAGGYDDDDVEAWVWHGLTATDDDIPGFAGETHTPAAVTVDLSAYAGGQVQVRWAFISDGAYSAEDGNTAETIGWFVDNIDISDAAGSIFSNDGSDVGGMIALRLGTGEAGPWEAVAGWAGYPGTGIDANVNLTTNIIGAPGDSFGVRFRAVFDDNDEGEGSDPDWGFEVSNAALMVYTRLANDIGPTFVDLDSTFAKGDVIVVGETFDPQVVVSNFGLSDFTIYNTFVKIENQFGSPVYERYIYTYAPGQGDTLFKYPDFQPFNEDQAFYNFPDWTPEFEGDYTLMAYTEVFGGDDEPLNDTLAVNFHVYSTLPAFFENFNDVTDDILNNTWTKTGDDIFYMDDIFGEGDAELTVFGWAQGADAEALIKSPAFDCSGLDNVYLKIQHWYRVAEPDPNSYAYLLVSNDDGATWDTLKTLQNDALMPSSQRYGWFMYDISAVADSQSQVCLGFYDKVSAGVHHFFTIDDIAVYSNPDLAPTGTPAQFTGTSGDMQVDLSWDAVAGASYYSVLAAKYSEPDSAAYVGDVSVTKFTHKNLTNNTDYYYWLTATDFNNNESAPIGPIMVTPKDATAPTKITDLKAEELTAGVKKIMWSAPTESVPEEGSKYDIRYAYAPITADNWAAATPVTNNLDVAAAGTDQSLEVSVTRPTFDVWFAIVTIDEVGNTSDMSNVALADDTPPGTITDLEVVEVKENSVTLMWTAKGDDQDQGGPADHFDIRVAYGDSMPDWEKAAKLTGIPKPAAPGQEQLYEAIEFIYPASTKMTFQMTVFDNNGNESVPRSNTVVSDLWKDSGNAVAEEQKLPETFDLAQNYPNPFNPTTAISYQLPKASFVNLTIYSATGQQIRTLVNGTISAGYHHINWDAMDDAGHKVASGIYFYRIDAEDFISIKKMTLMK